MTPKVEWAYVGNVGPNKETLIARLLTREMVSLGFERSREEKPGGGYYVEHASFPFRIVGVDRYSSTKNPLEILLEIFHKREQERWVIRGLILVGPDNLNASDWVYLELKYNSMARHSRFISGLDDLLAREEFTSAFKAGKQR